MSLAVAVRPRPDLEPIPRRMQHLPHDPDRGFPVPWFVLWIDGKPEFRATSRDKYVQAVKKRLCWVCGTKLESRFAFVAGPMCGISRTSSEPPSHIECARWSVRNCPFLSNPNMVRRQDDLINSATTREHSPGIAILRNPGVSLVWITREYEVFDDGNGMTLIQMGRPQEVEFYREGRFATRAEIMDSIDTGIASLEAAARTEEGGIDALRRQQRLFEKLIPKK